MPNKLILTLFISLSVFFVKAQRYNEEVFTTVESNIDVTYGSSTSQGGFTEDLKMDIYYPKDDTATERPVIILAHGGFFIFGDKESFAAECKTLARAGYVAVSINYRLIDIEGDSTMTPKIAAIDGIADMKAAVRFFRKDAATKNEYKIDGDNVFIGGYSAGAITALHYAYANTFEDVMIMGGMPLAKYIKTNGGLEGSSGNQGYSSEVSGVINIAGSLFDADMVDANEPPLFSVHGTEDVTVPFETGIAGDTKVPTEGSGLIHERANKIGLKNQLHVLEGADHAGIYDCETCIDEIRAFVYSCLK